jgi:hypothetical protein
MSNPPVFVVGVARSGTTLLRWMLESHPRIAIPAESHWIVELADRRRGWSAQRQEEVLTEVLTNPKYRRWWMSEAEMRAAAGTLQPSYAALVATVFGLYARETGKARWGDKTPWYLRHLDLLNELFPDAVFVHIIRDGRYVAASLAEGGGRDIVGAACYWRDAVRTGRSVGRRIGDARYCEILLDDLISQPQATLKRVCAAIGETYTPRMLDYPRRAWTLEQYDPKSHWRLRHLAKPPTPGLRDWRAGVSLVDRRKVEAICRSLLDELGSQAIPVRNAEAELTTAGDAPPR